MRKLVLPLIGLLLAGCVAAQAPSPTSTPSQRPGDMSFDSVVALKDAAVRTGFYCERWRQTDQVQLAVQSGTCSERDVFSIYLSSADVSAAVQALKRLPVEVHLLVGPNWIINSRYVLSLKENMGGMIVTASNG